jgi:hypothetical protein
MGVNLLFYNVKTNYQKPLFATINESYNVNLNFYVYLSGINAEMYILTQKRRRLCHTNSLKNITCK